ncbi:protease inhibitor I42 family protein [Pseudomonas sp. KSR10]|jgi:inhibitor of cysteine peptidase|uniref:Peptidase inhibitor I42 n=1 Tax=Stutzerimonas stutzeri TaxID=316 RepID=A0A0D9ARY5_STUST|nr:MULTISPECIES: protease inhibitor I42 family protein [Pseudomonadaceae]KJH83522.1 peptidase inhibitor I42 [Stutzerimonas stutzeri]MCG6540444.1 protease inhibitor I42 family protein [Pseudomonas sp. KSR10]
MLRSLPRLLPFAVLLALAGCAGAPPSSVALSDDTACPLSMQPGQTLILSLPSNPASGYRWSLREVSSEQLKSLGPEVFSSPKNDLIGGDGVSTWRFEAANNGSGRLYLTYQRPWENEAEPAGLFDCRIEVQ